MTSSRTSHLSLSVYLFTYVCLFIHWFGTAISDPYFQRSCLYPARSACDGVSVNNSAVVYSGC